MAQNFERNFIAADEEVTDLFLKRRLHTLGRNLCGGDGDVT